MKNSFIIFFLIISCSLFGQGTNQKQLTEADQHLSIPEFINANIPGAPKLGKPTLLMSSHGPLISQGMGWASPAVWDWNRDGKKDLLIGEFSSGMETGNTVGHFIRVYGNTGSDASPQFTSKFTYAKTVQDQESAMYWRKDPAKVQERLVYFGTPISIPQFCCMSIQPRFADINNDGFPDLYAGSYTPGEVFWFRGSEIGFLPGEKLKQYGNASGNKGNLGNAADTSDWYYWYSTQVSFGDFTGDGLQDMIVGGAGGLRLSKNIGTADQPAFGRREYILDTKGAVLWDDKVEESATPIVTDWDNDGVPDLLITNTYMTAGNKAILFYKGVRTNNQYRFQQPISLFDSKENSKIFPGDHLYAFAADWNNDGVKDLLIGTTVAEINNVFDSTLNWSWEHMKSYKLNPGYNTEEERNTIQQKIEAAEKMEAEIGKAEMLKRKKEPKLTVDYSKYMTKEELIEKYYGGSEKYKTLVHKGIVYLMLGEKR